MHAYHLHGEYVVLVCFLVNGNCDGPLNCVCMEGWSGDLCTECIPSEGCCKFYIHFVKHILQYIMCMCRKLIAIQQRSVL